MMEKEFFTTNQTERGEFEKSSKGVFMTSRTEQGKSKNSRKGFFMMADVVFALTLAIVVLAVAQQTTEAGQTDAWRDDAFHKMAEDVVAVLDKDGTVAEVAGMSEADGEAELESVLDEMLPTSMGANVTFQVFVEESEGVFDLRSSDPVYTVKVPSDWDGKDAAFAKRVYADIDTDDTDNSEFGVVEIRLGTVRE